MNIKKVRRKILIENEYKMKTLYECLCKWGTHSSTVCYLFDEPKEGLMTTAIKWSPNCKPMCSNHYSVIIDRIGEELIYLSMN